MLANPCVPSIFIVLVIRVLFYGILIYLQNKVQSSKLRSKCKTWYLSARKASTYGVILGKGTFFMLLKISSQTVFTFNSEPHVNWLVLGKEPVLPMLLWSFPAGARQYFHVTSELAERTAAGGVVLYCILITAKDPRGLKDKPWHLYTCIRYWMLR